MSAKERKAINLLKHLPAYPYLFGWNKNKLVDALMKSFIAPSPTDDTPKAAKKRAFIASYRINELSSELTPYSNRPPFTDLLQSAVNFDRLLEFSVQLGIDPFKVLPNHITGLTIGLWGNWIGSIRMPSMHIQDALDRFFIEKLGARHHIFMTTSDQRMMQLGYLSDKHIPQIEKNSWKGDRGKGGGDPSLRLTALAASFPMYAYTKKSVQYGFWDEPVYKIELIKSKNEASKTKSLQARYVRRSYHWGVERYKRLKFVREMAGHVENVNRFKSHIQQQETW